MEQNKGLNVVLLGKTGAGKSSTGNTILGREAFVSKKSSRSVTQDVAVQSGSVGHFPVTVYDTPGLFDTEMNEEEIQKKYKEVLQRCESGPCMFLLVIKADRFTAEEREAVKKIEQLLGDERLKKTWILFTRGDELEEENMTIQEFLDDTEPLKNLVQKYDQRYHVFNNKTRKQAGQAGQAQELFIKIFKPHLGEVLETLKQNPLRRRIPQEIEPDAPADSLSSRRLVLLGKSGVGKSAAGNTILGQREFISAMRMSSVTRECSEAHATVSDRSVTVVDTPPFFDTQMNPEELAEEIARSVYISSPGPHAFLIVLRVIDRFTEHELQIPQIIEMMFGEEVLKYSIILFTHGDQLEEESVEEIIEQNCRLRDLVQQCGGRYHVFNNRDLNNREQVNDLLQKIDSMIEQNGGGHYSNQMYEDAERFRREEEEQRQREEEQRKQQEEEQIQEKIERVKKETEERVRAEYEVRSELERLRAERQRDDEQRKQQEEKQIQEKIEGVKKETEERVRAEYEAERSELERHGAERQRDEEQRKQQEEKQIQEEVERVRKETEERVRAEYEAKTENKEGRFMQFFYKHQRYFYFAAVIAGIGVGGVAGGVLAKVFLGGAVLKMAAVGAVVGGAVGGGAASGTVAGAAGGAVAGTAVVGAVAGTAVVGAAATVGGDVAEVACAALGGFAGGIAAGSAAGGAAGFVGGAVVGGVTSKTLAGVCDGAISGAVSGALDGAAVGAVAGSAVAAATVAAVGGGLVGSAAAGTLDGVLNGIIAGAAVGAVSGGAAGAVGVALAFGGATD